MNVDAHQHFWRYSALEYGWIDDGMRAIRRDFLPSDLEREIKAAGVDGVITVQARQTLEETGWLLELARENDFIKGVVGWLPLTSLQLKDEWEAWRSEPLLKGVRHVVQDEPDGFLLRGDFNAGIGALRETGLVYDVLIREGQLPETIRFVDQHPNQIFVIDHLAKPLIREAPSEIWSHQIGELARREHVFCKVSGLVTEAPDFRWTEELLRPYFETVLAAFGADRLLFGSDWPVCLTASPYGRWHQTIDHWTRKLSSGERARIFGGTAIQVYRIAM